MAGFNVTLDVAPTKLPVTVPELKEYMSFPPDVVYQEGNFNRAIRTAVSMVQDHSWSQFFTATRTLTIDAFPRAGRIYLPYGPVQSVSSINYYDVGDSDTLLASSFYNVHTFRNPATIELVEDQWWPQTRRRLDAVRIQYVCGYDDDCGDNLPPEAITAILFLAKRLFENPMAECDMAFLGESYKHLIGSITLFDERVHGG